MATAIDLGDPKSPAGDIHPRYKQEVGERLAIWADKLIYGNSSVITSGPVHRSVKVLPAQQLSQGETGIRVNFDPSTIGDGLRLREFHCPYPSPLNCLWFEIQSSDTVWNNASISLVDHAKAIELRVVFNDSNLFPTAVRYGFSNWPASVLYNSVGLPALPFVDFFSLGVQRYPTPK